MHCLDFADCLFYIQSLAIPFTIRGLLSKQQHVYLSIYTLFYMTHNKTLSFKL